MVFFKKNFDLIKRDNINDIDESELKPLFEEFVENQSSRNITSPEIHK